jgi:hypothetical protein
MKKVFSLLLLFTLLFGISGIASLKAEPAAVNSHLTVKKKKKFKGFKKPKSKKFLGIFKRKSDCGCPNR